MPFTDNGRGRHVEIVKHLADGGFSVGGPVWIPKVYNGKNKTFFFFNWERTAIARTSTTASPRCRIRRFRSGDLSAILGRNLGTDFAGRAILQNAIYDPATAIIDSSGRRVLDVFPNNIIPAEPVRPRRGEDPGADSRSPISPTRLVNNFSAVGRVLQAAAIPSIKIDHSFSDKIQDLRLLLRRRTPTSPTAWTACPSRSRRSAIQDIHSKTFRLNYDHSLTPTLLLHLGAGVQRYYNPDTVPPESADYDNKHSVILNAPGTRISALQRRHAWAAIPMAAWLRPWDPAIAASTCT